MNLTYRVQNPVNNEVIETFETATDAKWGLLEPVVCVVGTTVGRSWY